MGNESFHSLRPDLISLGFAYSGAPSPHCPDPEATLVDVLKLFSEDQKLYRMLLAWMDRFGDLVHVERFTHLLQGLSESEKVVFGATALKFVNAGDFRFKKVVDKIMSENPKYNNIIPGQDDYLIEKYGIDPEFSSFGVRTAKIESAERKKIFSRRFILQNNIWLRLRALLGTNYRADIAYVRMSRLVGTAYGAMKLLGCSKETGYRLWRNLEEARIEEFVRFKV